jgi:hypothetical protein
MVEIKKLKIKKLKLTDGTAWPVPMIHTLTAAYRATPRTHVSLLRWTVAEELHRR